MFNDIKKLGALATVILTAAAPANAFDFTVEGAETATGTLRVAGRDLTANFAQAAVEWGDQLGRFCATQPTWPLKPCMEAIGLANGFTTPEQFDNLRVGQLVWLPLPETAANYAALQNAPVATAAAVSGDPVSVTVANLDEWRAQLGLVTLEADLLMVGEAVVGYLDRLEEIAAAAAAAQATADDAAGAALVAATAAGKARREAAVAQQTADEALRAADFAEAGVVLNKTLLDHLVADVVDDRTANAARFGDIDVRLEEQGNLLANKADTETFNNRFSAVEDSLTVSGFPLKTVGVVLATILLVLMAGGYFSLRRQIGGVKKTAVQALSLAHEAKVVAIQAMARADLALSMMFDGVKFIGDIPTQAHFDALDEGQYQPITISVGGQTANLKLCREGDKFFLLGTTSRARVEVKDAKSLTGTLSKHCVKANREGFATAFTPHLRAA